MKKTDLSFVFLFSFLGIVALFAVGGFTSKMNLPINITFTTSIGNTTTIIITQLSIYAFVMLCIVAEYARCGIKGYKDFKRWDKALERLKLPKK